MSPGSFLVCIFLNAIQFLQVASIFKNPFEIEEAPANLKNAFVLVSPGIREFKDNDPSGVEKSNEALMKEIASDKRATLNREGKQTSITMGQSFLFRYNKFLSTLNAESEKFTHSNIGVTKQFANCLHYAMNTDYDQINTNSPACPDATSEVTYDQSRVYEHPTWCSRYALIRNQTFNQVDGKLNGLQQRAMRDLNAILKSTNYPSCNLVDYLYDFWKLLLIKKNKDDCRLPVNLQEFLPKLQKLAHFALWSRIYGKRKDDESILSYVPEPLLRQANEEIECTGDNCIRFHAHVTLEPTITAVVWRLTGNQEYIAKPGDGVMLEADHDGQRRLYLLSPLDNKFSFFNLDGGNSEELKTLDDWINLCNTTGGTEEYAWQPIPEYVSQFPTVKVTVVEECG